MANQYNKVDLKGYKEFLDSLPKELIDLVEEAEQKENEQVYDDFVNNLKEDKCFLCGNTMDHIDMDNPCFHWFAHPTIKKKCFDKYLSSPVSYYRLSCYLRWLANYENPICNINDSTDDISSTCISESTIKYKNIEWSFSLGNTDYEGHNSTNNSSKPHYHIQVIRNGNIFIRFNDYHILFTDDDLFNIEMIRQNGGDVEHRFFAGEGISLFEQEELIPDLLDEMSIEEDESKSSFRLQTIIDARENPITGEVLAKAMEESQRTNQPIQIILKRLLSEQQLEKSTTIVSLNNEVKKAKRSGKK